MRLLNVESLKLKNSYLGILSLLFPFLGIFLTYSSALSLIEVGETPSKSLMIYILSSNFLLAILLPLYIIIVLVIYSAIENSNNGWKLMAITQVPIKRVVTIKWAVTIKMIAMIYMFYCFIICLVGVYYVEDVATIKSILLSMLYSFICILPIITLMFFIFTYSKSVMVNVVFGIVFMVSNFLIIQTKLWIYSPLSYYVMVTQCDNTQRVICLISSTVFTLLIYILGLSMYNKCC